MTCSSERWNKWGISIGTKQVNQSIADKIWDFQVKDNKSKSNYTEIGRVHSLQESRLRSALLWVSQLDKDETTVIHPS